jgi:NADH-quinone oxidoreductase subunit N
MVPQAKDILSIGPQLVLLVVGMVVLLADAIWPRMSKRIIANISILGLLGAGIWGWTWMFKKTPAVPTLQGMVLADPYTGFFTVVLCLAGILGVMLSVVYLDKIGGQTGEYYALLLFTTLGGMVMSTSPNLICIFIGLEILSIALYILAGYQTEKIESDESAMKYFLLGAFASAFFLYGIALIYGATGTLNVMEITSRLAGPTEPAKNFLLLAGVSLLLVGFGFKVAVVPFHIWTPDVYEGAPTSVTAFMSVTAKAAGFAAFLRVLVTAFQDSSLSGLQLQISAVLASIAALTMLVGNVVAVVQPSLKRMLAYSSIAHAGYMLAGLVAAVRPGIGGMASDARDEAVGAVLFYTLVYAVSNLGAFGVLLALRKKGEEVLDVKDLAGVGYRYPWLGVAMTVFMLSLAGMPPFAGFFGKLYLVQALVQMSQPLVWLIVLFALTSAVSFYYYLGVVRSMWMDRTGADAGEDTAFAGGWHLRLALGISVIGTIGLGLWAGGGLGIAQKVAESFLTTGNPLSALR